MAKHEKVLDDSIRMRAAKPTYAVRVPAVAVDDLTPSVLAVRDSLKHKGGAILYLTLDGRYYRATLEVLL